MGHKYLVPALFNDAAERLQVYFPCALKDWHSALDELELHEDEDDFDCVSFELYDVVKRVGLHRSLPALCFYYIDLCTLVSFSARYCVHHLNSYRKRLQGLKTRRDALLSKQKTA